MEQNLIALGIILILVVVVLLKTAVVVPQRSEFVVERLGKYRTTLEAGVMALDEAATNWGIKVLRYEIKDIQPPRTVLEAKENNTMIVPGNLTDLSGMVASAMATFQHLRQEGGGAGHPEIRPRS